jgi:ABC-type branched-subunit amino acid transport system ATPase component
MELETESVTKVFAGLHALSEVSVCIGKGEIAGIIGPNGSGKTTLINVISGVIQPTSGRVRLGEETWTHRVSYRVARAGIARTFQTIRLFREMTVLENVEVAATASPSVRGTRAARRASREALASLELAQYSATLAATLPYGLQRRVEIARAIVTKPHFLLLDEPAAGLNETESDELVRHLLDVREQVGCGVVLIDHDLHLIMRATDRIFVLNEGRLLVEGKPEEIRHDPQVIRAYIGRDLGEARRRERLAHSAEPVGDNLSEETKGS